MLVVRDDGRGFDPAAVGKRRGGEGLGLLGMRRQASWLGGQATVRSRPGSGTVVRISVPLERHRAGLAGAAGESTGAPGNLGPAEQRGTRRRIERPDEEG